MLQPESLECAKQAALESCVLLKNNGVLPINADTAGALAVIGPLADAADDQMGCRVTEPGDFEVWTAPHAEACTDDLKACFQFVE